MSLFSNYKCPNGLPPEECGHVPQLIANVSRFFLQKKDMNKVKDVTEMSQNRTLNVSESSSIGQKQRRR